MIKSKLNRSIKRKTLNLNELNKAKSQYKIIKQNLNHSNKRKIKNLKFQIILKNIQTDLLILVIFRHIVLVITII